MKIRKTMKAGAILAAVLLTVSSGIANASRSSEKVFFLSQRDVAAGSYGTDLYSMEKDGSMQTRLTMTHDVRGFSKPGPLGLSIAISNQSGMWIFYADGSRLKLTSNPADLPALISNDGKTVIFKRINNGVNSIYSVSVDTTVVRLLVSDTPTNELAPVDVSVDGKNLLIANYAHDDVAHVYGFQTDILNTKSLNLTRLSTGTFDSAPWLLTPDGKSALITTSEYPSNSNPRYIIKVNIATKASTKFSLDLGTAGAILGIFPDRHTLLYVASDGYYKVDFVSGNYSRIPFETNPNSFSFFALLSNDGKRIVISGNDENIYSVGVDGNGFSNLTNSVRCVIPFPWA